MCWVQRHCDESTRGMHYGLMIKRCIHHKETVQGLIQTVVFICYCRPLTVHIHTLNILFIQLSVTFTAECLPRASQYAVACFAQLV